MADSLQDRSKLIEDLSGKVFGKLTVIDFSHVDKHSRAFWNCICECGELTKNATATLNCGNATQCFKCGRKFKEQGHAGLSKIIKEYQYGARDRGLCWELTRDDVAFITKQNCTYCGCEPSRVMKTDSLTDHGHYVYNGIDRVDSTKGYIIDNVVACCTKCNWMKSNLSINDFKEHIMKIYNNITKDE